MVFKFDIILTFKISIFLICHNDLQIILKYFMQSNKYLCYAISVSFIMLALVLATKMHIQQTNKMSIINFFKMGFLQSNLSF